MSEKREMIDVPEIDPVEMTAVEGGFLVRWLLRHARARLADPPARLADPRQPLARSHRAPGQRPPAGPGYRGTIDPGL